MHAAIRVAAVDDVGIERVGGDVAALARAHRSPVTERDLPEIAAARHPGGARVLLGAIHAVGEGVVRDHVVELRRGLIVPAAPGSAVVERDHRALVAAHDHARRAPGIHPQLVIIVAARLSLEHGERLAAITGSEERHVGHVHDVGILGINRDPTEVPVAARQPRIAPHQAPRRAAIVRAVQTAVRLRSDQRIDPSAAAGRETDAADRTGGKTVAAQESPSGTAVGRLVQAAPRSFVRGVLLPRRAARLVERGVYDLGIGGIRREVDGPGIGILVQHFGPGAPAVGGAEHAALGIGAVGVSQRRDEHNVGIPRIYEHLPDVPRLGEAECVPVSTAVGGLVDAGAVGDVGADRRLAGPHVDHVRIGRRQGKCPDRGDRLVVEQRLPGDAGVPRAPHAAVHGTEVERGRIAGDSGHRQHAAAAVRPDEAPPQRAVRVRRDGLGGCRDPEGQGDRERGEQRGGSDLVHGREVMGQRSRSRLRDPGWPACDTLS